MQILSTLTPGKQFMALMLILFASILFVTLFGILLAIPFVNGPILEAINRMGIAQTAQDVSLLKYFQIVSQLGLFITSSFVFAVLTSKKVFSFLGINSIPKLSLVLLALLIGFVSYPIGELIIEWNSSLSFPDFLSGLEQWMRSMEAKAAETASLFLSTSSWSGFLINLLMMAVLAGLGEELLLRGVIQPLFIRWTKNAHAGIWLAAAFFSFLHFQFFGFVPRMLLGALFGYYYYWSKNLWIPILAHIINNGIIVSYAFYHASTATNTAIKEIEIHDQSFLVILLSVSLTFAGVLLFYRESQRLSRNQRA
ncbi:MAG: CPBP family intramembrane metalloprotease [Bacteroidales bacterium]|nr:CPBP family intramembrane metalloprotease [Bacteroidales bacterium]